MFLGDHKTSGTYGAALLRVSKSVARLLRLYVARHRQLPANVQKPQEAWMKQHLFIKADGEPLATLGHIIVDVSKQVIVLKIAVS